MSATTNTTNTTTVDHPPPNPAPPSPVIRARPAAFTMDEMCRKFVALRDQLAALKKEQAKQLLPFAVAMDTLNVWMLAELNATKVESARTLSGTAYKTLRTSATVEDWAQVLAFIREHEAWELLEARVSKLAVQAIMEETQQAVPGVKTSQEVIVNVRRG